MIAKAGRVIHTVTGPTVRGIGAVGMFAFKDVMLRLFARPPLVAGATGGKSEAVCARSRLGLRLFPHFPLDANATGGKLEAVRGATPLR